MKIHYLLVVAIAAVLCGCALEHPISYTEPLTSPGGQFSRLPPAVQNSVRAEGGMAEISRITRSDTNGSPIYTFYFKNAETFQPLYVASDGSVLRSDMTVAVGATAETLEASTGSGVGGIRMGDLPPNVVVTIRHSAPTAVVASISRLTSEGETFYEIAFEDPANHPVIIIRDDGHLLQ
jgi:hypothetical protein